MSDLPKIQKLVSWNRPIPRNTYTLPLWACPVCDGTGTVFDVEDEVACPVAHPEEDPAARPVAEPGEPD